MLTFLFAVTVAGALLLQHYFVNRSEGVGARSPAHDPVAITLTEAIEDLPGGIFLQPSFTWTRIRGNGELFLGIHPLLLSLVGTSHELGLLKDDSKMKKGAPLLRIQNGEREIRLFSPVAGRIVEVNDSYMPQTGWAGSARRKGSWVYRIIPDDAAEEVPSWLLGKQAMEWTHQQYRNIRDFLVQTTSHEEIGRAAADGGELQAGILGELNDQAWEAFRDRFIPIPGKGPEA